jgi:hypothetical protein
LKRHVTTEVKHDAKVFYLDEGTQDQRFMHEHKEHKAYLWVLQLTSIYSGKRPNEHATIMGAEGK